jgi:hypothetical protein
MKINASKRTFNLFHMLLDAFKNKEWERNGTESIPSQIASKIPKSKHSQFKKLLLFSLKIEIQIIIGIC